MEESSNKVRKNSSDYSGSESEADFIEELKRNLEFNEIILQKTTPNLKIEEPLIIAPATLNTTERLTYQKYKENIENLLNTENLQTENLMNKTNSSSSEFDNNSFRSIDISSFDQEEEDRKEVQTKQETNKNNISEPPIDNYINDQILLNQETAEETPYKNLPKVCYCTEETDKKEIWLNNPKILDLTPLNLAPEIKPQQITVFSHRPAPPPVFEATKKITFAKTIYPNYKANVIYPIYPKPIENKQSPIITANPKGFIFLYKISF